MKTLLPAAWLVAALAFAPFAAADEKELKGDLAKLQGTWKAGFGPNEAFKVVLTLKDHAVTATGATGEGEAFEFKGEFTIDETAKPKTIDWKGFTSADGEAVDDILAIYEFTDGGKLKICSAAPGKDRPTEFKLGEGGGHVVTLSREKDEAVKTSAADAPKAKTDLDKFQGKWTILVGPQKDIPITLVFKENSVTLSGTSPQGQEFAFKGEIKLDETAKPKTIDWIRFQKPDGEDAPANLGIYEVLDDGSIRVCSGGPGNERPTEFKAGENGPPNLVVMKRAKD